MDSGAHRWNHIEIMVLWYIESVETAEGTRRKITRRNCIGTRTGQLLFITFCISVLPPTPQAIKSLLSKHDPAIEKEFKDSGEIKSQHLTQETVCLLLKQ